MVPVKKPGRPLSACPHLHNQLCGCSSVTAAIPRKQKCHCGTGASTGPPLAVQPRPVLSAIPDIPSPTKVTFRVQKPPLSSRPGSRKQSYDLSSLERMDASSVNIAQYQTSATQPVVGQALNGNSNIATNGSYVNGLHRPRLNGGIQDPTIQSQYLDLSFPHSPTNGEYLSGYLASGSAIFASDGSHLQPETQVEATLEDVIASSNASCCATKAETSNHTVIFEPEQFERPGSKGKSELPGASLILSKVTPEAPVSNGRSETQHYLFSGNFPNTQDFYPSFAPQTTIYEYPASYGSYQQPLQPLQWHRDFRSNTYAQSTLQSEMMNDLTGFNGDTIPPTPKTQHLCSCGSTCQCIGCAAHPYNATTRNYVLSAYAMSHETSAPTSGEFSNGHTNGTPLPSTSDPHANGNGHTRNAGDEVSPPHGDTPSDSSTVDEQTLPASDYIFVNYPFSSEGCGGDTSNCPCGDECECIGCTIHRFDESSMALPSESWANEHIFTNGDDSGLLNGTSVKNEHLIDTFFDEPKRSCCG
jgi:hypothetical protein